MSGLSTKPRVVKMEIYKAIAEDSYAECKQLLDEGGDGVESELQSFVLHTIRHGHTQTLEVLLRYAVARATSTSALTQEVELLMLLEDCFSHACKRATIADNDPSRPGGVDCAAPLSLLRAKWLRCAAMIFVVAEKWPTLHESLFGRAHGKVHCMPASTSVVNMKLYAANRTALASITSEPMCMWAAFVLIRHRATEICIAMQELFLPAPITMEILEFACYPPVSQPKHYDVWRLVTKVKHFRVL